MKGHRVAAFDCPHLLRSLAGKGDCSRLKRAWLLVSAPVRRWQSKQWHIEMRDGSPSILRTTVAEGGASGDHGAPLAVGIPGVGVVLVRIHIGDTGRGSMFIARRNRAAANNLLTLD